MKEINRVYQLKKQRHRVLLLYVWADHDSKPYWCGLTKEQCNSFHSEIDGNLEVWCMELPELCVAGLSNSTDQITETGLQQMKEICSRRKPVILLPHVPYQSLVDSSLQDASKEVWQDRALVWGEGCSYQPDPFLFKSAHFRKPRYFIYREA